MPNWNDSTIPDSNLSDRELAIRQSEQADTQSALQNVLGGALSASTDVVITSKTGGVSGDIILKAGNPATEMARWVAGVGLGIGITTGLSAPLHVRIPGTGTIAQFEPSGGGHQYYHLNELGFGAVGDDTNLPYIAVENQTAQDIRLKLSVTNAAGLTGTLQVDSLTGLKPILVLKSTASDVYVQAGDGSTNKKRLKVWAQSGMTVSKSDGTGTVLDVNPDLAAIGFYGTAAASRQAVTGALSTVADAAAKAVLTSLISALSTPGLITNSTT